MEFPERLKQLRKEKGLTQVEFAKEMGVSTGTVAMWETGRKRPQFETLDKLCEYFDRDMSYLLGTSDTFHTYRKTEEEIDQMAEWWVEEEYEDVVRKYALLDEYGKAAVDAVLRAEFNWAQEQGTLNNSLIISVSVRSKQKAE